MKYFLALVFCIFTQIVNAQTNSNKTLVIDYQLIKSSIIQSELALKGNVNNEKISIKLLIPTGEEQVFEIEETSNFAPELATKYPEIQTFMGVCTDDKMISVRFDISPLGYSATYINQGRITIIEPKDLSKNLYAVVPYDEVQNGWECGNATLKSPQKQTTKSGFLSNVINNGTFLKTLRIAIATTAEFTINNGGVSNALARINSLLSIVNAVYIPDLAIKFELIANNTSLIFTDIVNDPFPTPSANYSANDSQNAFDGFHNSNLLTYSSYDIAHTLHANTSSTGSISSGGVAYIGVVCSNFSKALGWTQYTANNTNTSINSVTGGILTHELGHQMGANHNFNGQGNNCTSQLGNQFEPGSGSTIMAYLGLCGSQNLTGNKDNFFHIATMESILYELSFTPTCGTNTPLTNALPVVNAGADYTVPSNTPFVLKGTATDANNDPLSYTWEQKDEGVYDDAGALGQTNGIGGYPAVRSKKAPLFRTKQSTTTATRSFPAETFVLNNANNPNDNEGEDLSIANRIMTFSLTARDYKTGGGGTVSDEILVTVDSLKGPFLVTSPNTAVSWGSGSSQTITWLVNNTNILSPNIDILIAVNGSNANPTFTTLVSNTPNDGSQNIIIPSTLTSQGRIKIVSRNSSTAEFYDISNTNFSIVTACPTSNVVFSSNKTGVWSDLTVWNCGSIATNRLPNITDTVKINTGHIVTLDVNASVKILNLIGRLNVNAGRVLSY